MQFFIIFLVCTYVICATIFVSYINFGFLSNNENANFILDIYSAIPYSDTIINTSLFIVTLVYLSFFYSLYKKFAPRWRVKIGDKIIKKLRKNLNNKLYSEGQCLSYLRKIDPFVFEELLLSIYKERGFKIKRNKRYTGDGGIDGIVWIDGCKTYIQAKRYKSYIQKKHVLEFILLTEKDHVNGVFIHTGKTGAKTKNEAFNNNIEIISGRKLIDFIQNKKKT